jgi:hypothetical protein
MGMSRLEVIELLQDHLRVGASVKDGQLIVELRFDERPPFTSVALIEGFGQEPTCIDSVLCSTEENYHSQECPLHKGSA